ncbi:MAG TPA: L-threonylcarbamoyladenylate synthase [Chlamydiales bacterium]|jgi:L-threonylcarbamoyladenylate synthase
MKTLCLLPHEIETAIQLLKSGEPVAMPTETVYGLAAPLFNAEAVRKVFVLKGRPLDNPLIAHVSSLTMVDLIAENLPPSFYRLASHFWPGPLTLIVPRRKEVPEIVSAGHPTIAVRMPSHPLALQLIEGIGPLVAPSANLSGKPSPTTAAHVLEDLEGRLSAILDGGACSLGIESTVLSLVHVVPTLMRPGSIRKEELEAVLGQTIALSKKEGPIVSPGMKYRHYAPKAELRIVTDPAEAKGEFVLSKQPVGTKLHRPLHAKTLYGFFREADRLQEKEIWVVLREDIEEGLKDRILTASLSIR